MQSFGSRSLTKGSAVFLFFFFATCAFGQATWERSLSVAIKHATTTHTPIFIDLYAEWCGPCKMLEKDVFSVKKVQTLLKRATCLRLDVDQHQDEARRFNVTSIPRLLLLSPDGKKVLWDAMGYRDAETFAKELRDALGVKDTGARAMSNEPPALTKVQESLESRSFQRLRVTDPKLAAEGMTLLVAKLGAFSESDFNQVATILTKAGRDAVPALIQGMASKTLAVRVGSYKVLQAILPKGELSGLSFNPWANTPARENQLSRWSRLKILS